MNDYDLEADARETAWAQACGFDNAAAYHAAADEVFQTHVDELVLFEGNAE